MFVFRRILETDSKYRLVTGNKVFNDLTTGDSIETYIEQDILKGGDFHTYLLFKKEDEVEAQLLGRKKL